MSFVMDPEEIKQGRYNVYFCSQCRAEGKEHRIEERPDGVTSDRSFWGAGIPSFKRVCTGCGSEDGPWVSAALVGGGY